MKNNFDLRKFLVENKLTENSRVQGDLGFASVQGYIENKYGKNVLKQIYDDVTRNEWDYLVNLDSKQEVDSFVSDYID